MLLKASLFQYKLRIHLEGKLSAWFFVLIAELDILVQVGVATADVANVALEVLDVDSIEANDRCVEANIELGQLVTKVERTAGFGKILLCAVKRLEQSLNVLFVSFLCAGNKSVNDRNDCKSRIRCKARLVNTVVDVVVSPFISLFDLLLEIGRQEIDLLELLREEIIESVVEHSNDLAALIVDDALLLFVVECRYGEAALVVLVVCEVDITKMGVAIVQRVRCGVVSRNVFIRLCKSPTLLKHLPMDRSVRDDIFKALELTDDQSTVCPGAGI